ncbi:hypothetical protein C0992_007899 [Termitomyces sp. T32_za158]|nr:hypothetical protein C0992_007899 [Termitomyces sp. T32_za158]
MFPEPSTPFTPYDHIIENSTYRTLHSDGFSHDLDQENLAGPSYENIPARQPPKSSKPVADNSTASEEKTEEDSKNGLPRKPELVYKRQKDPGIGQCVGARNQKFFFNFIQAGSVYTIYICVTLLVFVVLRASTDGHIDPQRIVVIALAALFGMFTTVMQCTHFRLIWIGQTTVEGIQAHRMRHREKQAMNDVIGCWAIMCGFPELVSFTSLISFDFHLDQSETTKGAELRRGVG